MNPKNRTRDIREELTTDDHANAQAAPSSAADAPVEIRLARPEDAEGLARCFYRAYGDSYDHAWAYQPDALRLRWSERVMVSVVGLASDGEVIGHLAANFERHKSRVAESGQAVVDPRYRGHHLFESMKEWLADWAGKDGLYGLFSEATAVHPYSQRGNLTLGAHEMGFLVGYIPSGVDYKQITDGAASQRKTAALMYLPTSPEPDRVVHPPAAYRDIAMSIYGNAGLSRTAGTGEGSSMVEASQVHLQRDNDHNAALLHCQKVGADLDAKIATHADALKKEGVDCVYLDLPLADPEVFSHGADLNRLGFVFSCILPEIRDDGDVLRLQKLNGVDPHIDEIATASDFGRALLSRIAADLKGTRAP
jgi:GNAT superfamily N-acetyltransferase